MLMNNHTPRRTFLKGACLAASGLAMGDLAWAAEEKPVRHAFICTDLYKTTNHLVKVNADGKIVWTLEAGRCHDFWALPEDHLLIAENSGVSVVDEKQKKVWKFKPKDKDWKTFSCQPLDDDLVLVGCHDGKRGQILEVNRKGEEVKRITSEKAGRVRLCRKTPQGTYLVGMYGSKAVVELDGDGKPLHDLPLSYGAYLAVRLPNGHTLIACAEGHSIKEVDKDWKTVWQIEQNELKDITLYNVAGIQRLTNGNTVICNWQGHGHIGEQPQIIEVTTEKNVVWQVFDNERFAAPAHVHILDDEGRPDAEEIFR